MGIRAKRHGGWLKRLSRKSPSATGDLSSRSSDKASRHRAVAPSVRYSERWLSRIAQLYQQTALADQCLHSAEADVRPPRVLPKADIVMSYR